MPLNLDYHRQTRQTPAWIEWTIALGLYFLVLTGMSFVWLVVKFLALWAIGNV